jgi:hypothetical protein
LAPIHKCLICESDKTQLKTANLRDYHWCLDCGFVSMNHKSRINLANESERYLEHKNKSGDLGYRASVQELVDQILKNENTDDKGLDYGCGEDSAVVALLQEQKLDVDLYDPLFYPNANIGLKSFDYVVASEVVEHFREPLTEWQKMSSLVKAKGRLYVQTLSLEKIKTPDEFARWYYARDLTHFSFYSELSMKILAKKIGLPMIYSSQKVFVFQKQD